MACLRLIALVVGFAAAMASWAEITVGVNSLSVVHKNSDGLSISFPDVCKTPTPSGPVPIPYPNVAQTSDTAKGSKRTKMDAPEKPSIGVRQPRPSSPATRSTVEEAVYTLEVETGGKLHIRQTAGRNSVTTATYVNGNGNKLQVREHALIKLANGDLCAICATKDGRVIAVHRLVPNKRQRRSPHEQESRR